MTSVLLSFCLLSSSGGTDILVCSCLGFLLLRQQHKHECLCHRRQKNNTTAETDKNACPTELQPNDRPFPGPRPSPSYQTVPARILFPWPPSPPVWPGR